MKVSLRGRAVTGTLILSAACMSAQALRGAAANETGDAAGLTGPPSSTLDEVVVTGARRKLIGIATTASEGVVVNDELALAPAYRPGQLLETVPGLAVTLHSGEGKANQYLLRGYNLDHGTDLATFVDEMPVNQPSHAHGQGYTDLNFLIPELATNIRYTKGTYYASEGDFSAVGAVHVGYLDAIEDQVSLTAGTWGFQRLLTTGSIPVNNGNLLGALELQHYDGPWAQPGDQRKVNAVLRYSEGDTRDGYSLTGSFYHGLWNNQTDQPERAITEGLISRFGELDPSDQGRAQRLNLSGQYFSRTGGGQLAASVYAFSNRLSLINNFTHFLVDPINGDQEEQHEDRSTIGAALSYGYPTQLFGLVNEWLVGAQVRYDFVDVSRRPTRNAEPIAAADDPLGFSERDQLRLGSDAAYVQATTHWSPWFRTVLGLREDYQYGTDAGTSPGSASRAILEPKASLIFRPIDSTELYVSAGRGFHSDDIRGVNQARLTGIPGAPLMATQMGEEIGVRQELFARKVALTFAVFNLDAQSETQYNPDVGQDSAGPASRRYGYELNITYQVLRWLEFYATLSQDHARFKTPFDDGTGHIGYHLPNAPFATGSFATYIKALGPWSGSLQLRYLGGYPLSSDNAVQGSGYHEWNGDVRYELSGGWKAALGVYNLLNTKANAMEYWYVDRLPGESAAGVADVHVHPLEPISMRLTLTKNF
ncbi:MAG TPA: TonB-dependent receptor [Steroidobacteraceae bacterium]|jgi:outer membrane receptor protein involved in Fe transport